MKLKPILTEKSLEMAKKGKYSFVISRNLNKFEIASLVEDNFKVHVKEVKTINSQNLKKKSNKGKWLKVKIVNKAVVTLKDKEKIDILKLK